MQKKLEAVEQRLARGMRPSLCMQWIRDEWGCSESTAWEYIKTIRDRWASEAAAARPENRAAMIAQAHELLAAAWAASELKEVRGALALLGDLYGLRLRAVVVKDDAGALNEDEREAIAALLHARPTAPAEKPATAKPSKSAKPRGL